MIRVRIPQKKKELEVPGPRRVGEILAAAGIRPTTVIVTQGKRLLTRDQRVEDGETIDVLSVVWGGYPSVKGKRCRKAEPAVALPSHNSAFCPDCFFLFFRRQVSEGIRKLSLLSPEDRILVCVSGGKDSLVLWDVLMELGYPTEGLYIDLGIEGYSDRSPQKVLAYAGARGKEPIVVDLRAEGIPIPEAAKIGRAHVSTPV